MEFKYPGILFTREGIIEWKIDRQVRVALEVFQMLRLLTIAVNVLRLSVQQCNNFLGKTKLMIFLLPTAFIQTSSWVSVMAQLNTESGTTR